MLRNFVVIVVVTKPKNISRGIDDGSSDEQEVHDPDIGAHHRLKEQ